MRPLDGIRVIDLSRVVSGPFCTMMLADMGADVVKIEEPGRGDEARAFGPPYQGGESPYFLSVNRNKRSCTLDLKRDDAKAVLHGLLASADVLVENFRPGAMARLGFDYPTVAERYPRVVYCSISGFGDTGPDAGRPGYDLIVQGESGLMDLTGDPAGPPTKIGTSIADHTSGLIAMQGVLLALYARQTTGRGQHVHIAMLDALASLLSYNAGAFFASGKSPTRHGNSHPMVVPYQTLEARDGWITLGVANDSLWRRYCDAIGRPDLRDDPRFDTVRDRVAHRDELMPTICALTKERTVDDWLHTLGAAGIPCGRIRSVADVCTNPQLVERGKIVERPHPTAGGVKTIAPPIQLSETPARVDRPPPLLGEHTDEILGEAGCSPQEIERLRQTGVV